MLRKSAMIALLTVSTIGMSGCSSMWSGIGSFSNFMAEKTQWASLPSLRGAKTVSTADMGDVVTYEAATSDYVMPSEGATVEMFDTGESYETSSYSSDSMSSMDAPMFDADGNYIDTSPVACPEGTYMTADETCMFLEQTDYTADFTQ